MHIARLAVLAGLMVLLSPAASLAQRHAQPLKPGDPTRKAVLNGLRPPVQQDLGQRVIFQVNLMRVQNGWAFLDGTPLQPNGKPIDFRKTKYREAVEQGAFGGGIFALLHNQGGRWRVVTYRLGPTDVTWDGWDRQYHAPRAIFPYPGGR